MTDRVSRVCENGMFWTTLAIVGFIVVVFLSTWGACDIVWKLMNLLGGVRAMKTFTALVVGWSVGGAVAFVTTHSGMSTVSSVILIFVAGFVSTVFVFNIR
jgi:hypothetical protein